VSSLDECIHTKAHAYVDNTWIEHFPSNCNSNQLSPSQTLYINTQALVAMDSPAMLLIVTETNSRAAAASLFQNRPSVCLDVYQQSGDWSGFVIMH